jgi:hypothetical protein
MLGCLHGESHRSARYLSNRMPRTISTKPAYSVRWWEKNGCVAPERDVFAIVRREAAIRFELESAPLRGRVAVGDARRAWQYFPRLKGKVGLVITSPPYLDTTNFQEDQWLRLWFLGGRPNATREGGDDRHTNVANYWRFLEEAWAGLRPLLGEKCRMVVRIGGKRLDLTAAREGLTASLRSGLARTIRLDDARTSAIDSGQSRAFSAQGKRSVVEYDFNFVCT